MNKKIYLGLLLVVGLTLLSGCSISLGSGSGAKANDGGIFKSLDAGNTWQQKVAVSSIGGGISINNANVQRVILDPQDHLAVYLATVANGLIYSYDGGEAWQIPERQPAEMKITEALAIDSKYNCTVYAAAVNKIFKTTNCSRDWKQVYFGTRLSDTITALAVDWYNPAIVYAGTAEGNFMKSSDYGTSWSTIKRAENKIKKITVDPYDSRTLYVATQDNGIFKSSDQGDTWSQIKEQLGKIGDAIYYKDFVYSQSTRDHLFWATNYGIIKSTDGGDNWQALKLVTEPGKAKIFSLAIDPANEKNIYYATDSTFYKSVDGGENWIVKKLPTSRPASVLTIDERDPKVLYMGITVIKK